MILIPHTVQFMYNIIYCSPNFFLMHNLSDSLRIIMVILQNCFRQNLEQLNWTVILKSDSTNTAAAIYAARLAKPGLTVYLVNNAIFSQYAHSKPDMLIIILINNLEYFFRWFIGDYVRLYIHMAFLNIPYMKCLTIRLHQLMNQWLFL